MFVTELIGSLFSEILSEFWFTDWFVISTFHLISCDSHVNKRTFDEFPEVTQWRQESYLSNSMLFTTYNVATTQV